MFMVNNAASYLSKVGFSPKEKLRLFFGNRYGTLGVSLSVFLFLAKTCINLVKTGHDGGMKFLNIFSVCRRASNAYQGKLN